MLPSSAIADAAREARMFGHRAVASASVVLLLVVVLLGRMLQLQALDYEHFKTLSDDNRVKVLPIPPTRGRIFDRNGVVLAENIATFTLEIVPEAARVVPDLVNQLRQLIDISESDEARFTKLKAQLPKFAHVPLKLNLTEDEVARISVNRHLLPGVEVNARLTRRYPQGEVGSHLVGYVGRINEAELRILDEANYRGTSHVGKTGVERAYEEVLHGQVGYEHVETNAEGRVLRVLERHDPIPGRDLYLNADFDLQRAAEAVLGTNNGAIVAIEPGTGAVLAMASTPVFDPNLFVNGIEQSIYDALLKSPDRPLFNRAVKGQYPPGSTIKPFLGLGALELGVESAEAQSWCPGWFTLPNSTHRYRDWKKGGHGKVSMRRAIVESCDVYFYELSLTLGIERMHDYLSRFDFGRRTGIDLMGERLGMNPSPKWKRRMRNRPWYPGETLISGIGQGFTLTTPLQLAHATATLGARGVRIPPRVVMRSEDPITHASRSMQAASTQVAIAREGSWDVVIGAMQDVAHTKKGTANRVFEDSSYLVAGKTGTAQVFSIAQDATYDESQLKEKLRDHGIFIAFAPSQNPRIAISVLVENGGSGSRSAAPLARQMIDFYFRLIGVLEIPIDPSAKPPGNTPSSPAPVRRRKPIITAERP